MRSAFSAPVVLLLSAVLLSQPQYHQQQYTRTLPYATRYCYDRSLPSGMQQTLIHGSYGEALCTDRVYYAAGQEVYRQSVRQQLVRPPTDTLIALGSAEPSAAPIIEDAAIRLPSGEVLTYTDMKQCTATAYYCEAWQTGLTATGTKAQVGTVAVDPAHIPLGSRLFILTDDGAYIYGLARAEDTGSPYYITGNRVDLYLPTRSECIAFGVRACRVYILG